MAAMEKEIRAFLADIFFLGEDPAALAGDKSLIEAGIIDSTGVLELVGFLEEQYAHRDRGRGARAREPRLDRQHRARSWTRKRAARGADGRRCGRGRRRDVLRIDAEQVAERDRRRAARARRARRCAATAASSGVSGGIDSSVTLGAVRARLRADRVLALLMPEARLRPTTRCA